jgi:hypothetical protein
MANEIVPRNNRLPAFADPATAHIQRMLSSHEADHGVQEITRQGAHHITALQMQAAKAALAIRLAGHLYDEAAQAGDEFKLRAYERLLSRPSLSAACEADRAEFLDRLMASYNQNVEGLLQVAMAANAAEVVREFKDYDPRPSQEKPGFFRRLFS